MVLYLHSQSEIVNDLVAQLVEHLPFKERVLGSSPSPVTKKASLLRSFFYLLELLNAHMAELVDARA